MGDLRDLALEKIRERLDDRLIDSCTISKQANSYGATGAATGALEIVADDVPCRVIEGKSDTDDIGDQHAITESYTLVVPLDTALEVGYVVTFDSNNYQIIEIVTRHSDSVDAQAMMIRERV